MREQPGNRKAVIPISKQVQAAVTLLKDKLAGSPWPASEKDDLAKQDSGSKRETGEYAERLEQPGNRKAAIPISKQVQAAVTVLKEKLAGSPWPASEKDDLAKQDSGSKRETGE